MNFDLRPDGIVVLPDNRIPGFLRVAVAWSIVMHAVLLLTSPYLQYRPSTSEHVVEVDISEMPKEETPVLPEVRVRTPEAVPAPPPRPPVAAETAAAEAPPPPTREAIREKVLSRGILKVLGGKGAADPLPSIRVPSDLRPSAPRAAASPDDYLPRIAEEGGKARNPDIDRQVAASTRIPKTMAAQTFRTDTGLEAEITGGTEEPARSFPAIAATIRQYQGGIRYVYNRELLANPGIAGKMLVSFVIRPDGSVDSVQIRQSTLNWPPLDEAVRKRMTHWKFPPAGGELVRVVFPFVFHPEM